MEMDLVGIKNQNEYYTSHYFTSIFQENAEDTIKVWKSREKEEDIQLPWKKMRDISRQYYRIRDRYQISKGENQSKLQIQELAELYLKALGFENIKSVNEEVADGITVPIYHEVTKPNGAPLFWAFLSVAEERGDDILQGKIFGKTEDEDLVGKSVDPTNDEILSKLFFAGEEAPRFIMLIGINQIALIDRNKWNEKRYLQFMMDDIYSRHEESTFMAMTVLLHKESLCPNDGACVLDSLDENSHKHSAGVSDALKYALRECIEILGNEVIYDMKTRQGIDLVQNPVNASELTLECLRYMGYTSRSGFNPKQQLLRDWNFEEETEFICLQEIQKALNNPEMYCGISDDLLDYEKLFNDKVYSMLKTGNTPELLENYEKKYVELMEQSLIMQNGVIDHSNYANISSALGGNGFFAAHNEIVIRAKDGSFCKIIKSQEELDELISAEKEKVLNTKELKDLFAKIEKILSKNKDTQTFALLIQKHPELVVEYKDIDLFKKKVWVAVCFGFKAEIQYLLDAYYDSQLKLSELVKAAKAEKTDWENALLLFKQRFYVPFEIEPANQEDVILKESMPSFKYLFTDEQTKAEVTKDNLLDSLSTGERRAYYILNMIFQILVAKKEGKEKIIVLDDISESFDYRNKYAIIEYINDISEYEKADGSKLFKILLLTHNFDFYRTVASRITKRGNSYIAFYDGEKIDFMKGQYIKNIFSYYKTILETGSDKDNIIIAAIPFVRNLIEYTEDDKNSDYLLLTSILHSKDNSKTITVGDIQKVFNKHWCKSKELTFANGRESELVYDVIVKEADKILCDERLEIENKIILSIAARLLAEDYMIRKLSVLPNGEIIIEKIKNQNNQSGRLVSAYHKYINDENTALMDIIAMITPENIHIKAMNHGGYP